MTVNLVIVLTAIVVHLRRVIRKIAKVALTAFAETNVYRLKYVGMTTPLGIAV